MKTPSSLQFLTLAAALAVSPAFAQSSAMLAPGETAGLIGQTYTGVSFAYTHHVEDAPRILRRYGFVSSRPLGEISPYLDAAFKYDYTRGGEFGGRFDQHDLGVSFLRYFPQGDVKPYFEGEVGWLWSKFGGRDEDSFVYGLGGGVEFLLNPRVGVTPFVTYRDARQIEQRAWNVGAKLAFRANHSWSWSFTLKVDDAHNVDYGLGVQRRF